MRLKQQVRLFGAVLQCCRIWSCVSDETCGVHEHLRVDCLSQRDGNATYLLVMPDLHHQKTEYEWLGTFPEMTVSLVGIWNTAYSVLPSALPMFRPTNINFIFISNTIQTSIHHHENWI